MKNRNMLVPAIFLDRDGVLNIEKSYITSEEQLEIYHFAHEAVSLLKAFGYKIIVITNQSAIARGLMSEEQLGNINNKLIKSLPLDDLYYCPHYKFEHNNESIYNIECTCRKPEPGMIFKADKEHNIDLSKSFLIGDRESDIIAGKNAGLKTVLVLTGYGKETFEKKVHSDFVFDNLLEFAKFITMGRFK